MKRKFSDETYELAKAEYILTNNISQVCLKYDLNKKTFTKYLIIDGVYEKRDTTISEEKVKVILHLRKKGWGCKRIAEHVQCDANTVSRYIKSHGVEVSVIKITNRIKSSKYAVNAHFF